MMTVNLSKENKFWLMGLVAALLVSFFTFFVVKDVVEKVTKKSELTHQKELEKVQARAEVIANQARAQVEVLRAQNDKNYTKQTEIEGHILKQGSLINSMSQTYEKDKTNHNNTKNEKTYIPSNFTPSEQSAFISNFKYEPY